MARGQVKSIIGALNSKPSFEHEFAVEKSIADIKKFQMFLNYKNSNHISASKCKTISFYCSGIGDNVRTTRKIIYKKKKSK